MKRIILLSVATCSIFSSKAQKLKSIGIETGLVNSLSKSIEKTNFSKDVNLSIYYRKGINENNYYNFALGTSLKSLQKNTYQTQHVKISFESYKVFGIKNLFVSLGLSARRFFSNQGLKNSYTFVTGIATGYQYNFSKNIAARIIHGFELNLPTNRGVFYNFGSLGLQYSF